MRRRRRRGERGIALLLVLWVFMLLGVIALDFSEYMRDDAMSAVNLADGTRGYYVALAGMNRGMLDWVRHRERVGEVAAGQVPLEEEEQDEGPLVPPDGAWHEGEFHGARWAVRMTDEQSRIPLNPLCRARGDLEPAAQALLTHVVRYLVTGGGNARGAGRREAADVDTVVDSMLDWCDAGSERRAKGAENAYYQKRDPPYLAKNGAFDSPEELLLVRGVTPELYYGSDGVPGLRDVFSFYVRGAEHAKLNVRYVQPKVLEVLLGGADVADTLVFDEEGGPQALLHPLKAQLDTIYPGLGEQLEDREPNVVVIEARGDITEPRNQSRVAAVAELAGGDTSGGLPRIKRWFDRAPWEGVLPGRSLLVEGAS